MTVQTSASKVTLNRFNSKDGYDGEATKLKETFWYIVKTIFFLSPIPYPNSLKLVLLKLFGAKVGTGIVIKPRVNFHKPWKLQIDDFSWIGEEVFILNFEEVKIGKNCCISQRAFLCGGNHDYLDPSFKYRNGPIVLEDGVWIGASCFVGPNLIIGYDSVVAAGSVVTHNLNANSIYKGNPATFVKHRWV